MLLVLSDVSTDGGTPRSPLGRLCKFPNNDLKYCMEILVLFRVDQQKHIASRVKNIPNTRGVTLG